jgi:hypothetical protein
MSRSRIILNTAIGLYFLIYCELVVSPFVGPLYSIVVGVARWGFAKIQECRRAISECEQRHSGPMRGLARKLCFQINGGK